MTWVLECAAVASIGIQNPAAQIVVLSCYKPYKGYLFVECLFCSFLIKLVFKGTSSNALTKLMMTVVFPQNFQQYFICFNFSIRPSLKPDN